MILIVDDDGKDIVELLADRIRSVMPEEEIKTFVSSREALAWVKVNAGKKIDLVITDFMMPEYNGLELIGKISEMGSNPLFFILSAHDKSELELKPNGNKVSVFFKKPLSFKQIASFTKDFLSNIRK